MNKVRLTILGDGIGGVDVELYFDTAVKAVAWASANAPGKTVSIKGVSADSIAKGLEEANQQLADVRRILLHKGEALPAEGRSRLVLLESPYASPDSGFNTAYGRRCLLDSLARGEAPIASHLLYTQVLDDKNPDQRKLGINAGLSWLAFADAAVVYTDYGVSLGMQYGIDRAVALGVPVEVRKIE